MAKRILHFVGHYSKEREVNYIIRKVEDFIIGLIKVLNSFFKFLEGSFLFTTKEFFDESVSVNV